MVGHMPLEHVILVRIQVRQRWKEYLESFLVRLPARSFSGGGNPGPAANLSPARDALIWRDFMNLKWLQGA